MKEYYDRRAPEYDDWWLGRGLFAARERPGWEAELDEVAALLGALPPVRTLDIACGTGFITRYLPGDVVGLDQSASMIAIARDRLPNAGFIVGDALALPFPDESFARVHASFFYCHLEEPERLRFLAEARRVARELIVFGSRPGADEEPLERWEERTLEDGSRWPVFKRVFEPQALANELAGDVLHAGRWFVVVRSTT
ncbi:MAG TPA: class I SAM-dependent methyltransferase [Gaiellaceae bacterium]|nr:class I SAM-dependent methyltransferase [Gaiellaceae bacterium]